MDEFHKYNIEAKEWKEKKNFMWTLKVSNMTDNAKYQDNDYP